MHPVSKLLKYADFYQGVIAECTKQGDSIREGKQILFQLDPFLVFIEHLKCSIEWN